MKKRASTEKRSTLSVPVIVFSRNLLMGCSAVFFFRTCTCQYSLCEVVLPLNSEGVLWCFSIHRLPPEVVDSLTVITSCSPLNKFCVLKGVTLLLMQTSVRVGVCECMWLTWSGYINMTK